MIKLKLENNIAESFSSAGIKSSETVMIHADAGVAANYILKGIKLDSQSFSLGMGDNKTVSLSFSSQIGGPEQSGLGLFMSGYYQIVNKGEHA